MNPRHGIISACSWTIDRIKIVNQWPQEEHLAEIVATDQQGGGCGHNLAVDIRKLDNTIPVEAIGLVGDDADGQFLLKQVRSAGIDTTQLHIVSGIPTSFTDVMSVESTGRRTFFHHRGSHDYVTPDHFNFSQTSGKILQLGLLGVHAKMDSPWQDQANGWVAVLKDAQEHGIHTNLELVSVDESRIRDIALPCIAHLNSLIINEYELGALVNNSVCNAEKLIDKSKCLNAARSLFDHSKQHNGQLSLIVVHSPQAALAVTADGKHHWRSSLKLDAAQIVSSVGAGDAFAAGMLYGIHQAWGVDESLQLAHATAAASLRSATTVGSVESVDACLALAGIKPV